ncbi:MAG TPA: SRPBCC family protein [Actinomycetota bacterium]|jgi:ribosome-associated toxin RatA of RatAB toxin-antitoxin module|nr:SRPBCC family protein [Actinomycetota bacterium]
MAKVHKSKAFDVSADQMWQRVGDFHRLQTWLPGIEKEEKEGDARRLTMGNGMQMVEKLLDQSEKQYTYTISEGPLPIQNYVSTLRVRDAGDNACVVEWESEFDPVGIPNEQAVAMIEAIYDAGLNGLAAHD